LPSSSLLPAACPVSDDDQCRRRSSQPLLYRDPRQVTLDEFARLEVTRVNLAVGSAIECLGDNCIYGLELSQTYETRGKAAPAKPNRGPVVGIEVDKSGLIYVRFTARWSQSQTSNKSPSWAMQTHVFASG
jgi:hypothetical protein